MCCQLTEKTKQIILKNEICIFEDNARTMKKHPEKNNKIRNSVCVMLLLALLGFVITIQVKSVAMEKNAEQDAVRKQIDAYQTKISQLEAQLADNQAQYNTILDKYHAEMKSLYENNQQFYEMYKKYEAEIEQYKFYAGMTTVTGPGIDIGLDDAQQKYGAQQVFLVHDIYINEIINTLRAAGAQAISVNGERVVPMTETLCLGPSIRVNGTKLFAPYHIKAIGDPQTLLNALNESVIYKSMTKENIIVDPVIQESITIGKYSKAYEKSIGLLSEYK